MAVDICVVVYRPRWPELQTTVRTLARVRSEFRFLQILVSGLQRTADEVANIVRESGMVEQTRVFHRFDNLGFAGGQNFLLAEAFRSNADWALVYNPDLEVEENALSVLVESAKRNGNDSLYGPWIYKSGDAGGRLDSRGISWNSSARHFDLEDFNTETDAVLAGVQGLTGACMLVSGAVYQKIYSIDGEFFDKSFIAYREDAELGIRASSYGIASYAVKQRGFSHERGVPTASRKNSLVNLLSVQNRLLMRWKLGKSRPGFFGVPTLRDLIVVIACFSTERSSLPGLINAYKIRRYAKYKGLRLNEASVVASDYIAPIHVVSVHSRER